MTTILGISGKIGTGKTTVANMLKLSGAADAVRSFGDELKREASERFNFPLEWCYTPEGKDTEILHHELPANGHMTVRKILQWWGDVRRRQDPDYWVKRLQEWMLANRPSVLVIGDVRFREEAAWIVRHSGKLFRLEPYPEWKPGNAARHLSETALDDWLVWEHVFRPEWGELDKVALTIERTVKPVKGEPLCMPEWDEVPDGK